jgi:CheY-like chemotaxis protein
MEVQFPRVLVVEDEPIVRMYEAQLAESAGFITSEASDASEALWRLEQGEPVDILVTDLQMPGPIDGLELARLVMERWPDIKVVVVSSHVDSEATTGARVTYLRKPFTEH